LRTKRGSGIQSFENNEELYTEPSTLINIDDLAVDIESTLKEIFIRL
jgi:hypothetical protein